MKRLPRVKKKEELIELVEEVGFLPLFECGLTGFSVESATSEQSWWNEKDPEHDPWEWRQSIAREGRLCYAKLFKGKAGFISRSWYPIFANFRRNGYDFDSLWEEGLVPLRQKNIMNLFSDNVLLSKHEIKTNSGVTKGLDGTMTWLQMHTYLLVRDFRRRINAKGAEYGWPVSVYSSAETLLGYDNVSSSYCEDTEESKRKIFERCERYNPHAFSEDILKFIE